MAAPEASKVKPDEPETVTQAFSSTGDPGSASKTATSVRMATSLPGYEILGELGRGGMGVVYKARQSKLNRLVAVKMILAGGHAGPGELERFRTEAEAVARLQHAHIVQVHEIGEHDGLPYFSLEFCEGGSLARKLDGTPMPALDAVRLVETLAQAMHFAHQKNVIHRDLKPHNVLLAEDGTAKIGDFGLAKRLDVEGQTVTGARMGTPSYMAPEQAAGQTKDVGPEADIYGLGAILYECLTGRPPFKAATALETVRQVLSEDPLPPSRFHARIPRDVETICLKCLQKQPARRYGTARELAEDLNRVLKKEPIRARPVSYVERSLKWLRRRPLVAAVIGLIGVIFAGSIAGFGVLAWYFNEAVEAREAAIQERNNTANALKETEKARKRADEEKTAAQYQTKRAETVAAFMRELFAANDPLGLSGFGFESGKTQGQGLTARELLDRGTKKIGKVLESDPVTRAALMDTLGDVCRTLGLLDQAGPLLEGALELRRKHLQADHPDIGDTLTHLGNWLSEKGDMVKAVTIYGEALELLRKKGSSTDLAQAEVLLRISMAKTLMDDAAAVTDAKEGLDLRMKHLDRDHRDVALAKVVWAAALLDQGRNLEAVAPSLEALASLMASGGPETDGALSAALGYQQAHVLLGLGKPAMAEAKLRQSTETFRKMLGPDHVYNVILLFDLANMLEEQGKLSEAEKTYLECAQLVRKTVGMGQPRASRLVNSYGDLLVKLKKVEEAKKLFEESLQNQRERFGASLDWNLAPLVLLGEFEAKHGDLARAETIARDALERINRRPTPLARSETEWLIGFAIALGDRGNLDLTSKLYENAIAAERRRHGEVHESVFRVHLNYGITLVNRKQYERGDSQLRQALYLSGKIRGLPAERVAEMRGSLGLVEWHARNLAAAEEWFVKAVEIARSPLEEAVRAGFLEKLCCLRIQQGRYQDALPLLLQQQRLRIGSPVLKAGAQALEILVKEATGDSAGARIAVQAMAKQHATSPNPDIRAYLARVLALIGMGDGDGSIAAALDHAEAGTKIQSIPHTRYALALGELRAGQPTRVLDALAPAAQKSPSKPTPLLQYLRAHADYDISPSESKREAVFKAVEAMEALVEAAVTNNSPAYNYFIASQTLDAKLLSRETRARLAGPASSYVPYPAIKRQAPIRQEARVAFQVGPLGEVGLSLLDMQGKWQPVTYEQQGGTSSTVLHVDNQTAMFGSNAGTFERKPISGGLSNKEKTKLHGTVVWMFGKIRISQTVELHTSQGGKPDICLVRFDIENSDDKSHRVGLRQLVDTYIAGNDGHSFALPEAKVLITTKAEFKRAGAMPQYLQALQKSNLKMPGLVAIFTLKPGGGLDEPDRVCITRWPETFGLGVWEVPLREIGDDAAFVIYWDPVELGPGQRRTVGFACGHAPLSLPPRSTKD